MDYHVCGGCGTPHPVVGGCVEETQTFTQADLMAELQAIVDERADLDATERHVVMLLRGMRTPWQVIAAQLSTSKTTLMRTYSDLS